MYMNSVLGTTAAHQWSRCHDPLSTALARGTPVTLVGTVSRQPRVAGARGETVLTTLEVGSVDHPRSNPPRAQVRPIGMTF